MSGPRAATWGAVVPVKLLPLAKSRLGAYGDAARADLALAFAADLVAAVRACPAVGRLLVVTADGRAAAELAEAGAEVVDDAPDAGLDAALEHGARLLRAADPRGGVLALPSDLPALRPADLGAVLAQVRQRAFVADAQGVGTTLLAAAPGHELAPAYGRGSARRHRASGAAQLDAAPSLRRDVDTPADLQEALHLGVGARTAAVVGSLHGAARCG